MTSRVDPNVTAATVNEITARYPETIAVFNDFGVDACCGGDAVLREAAARDGVDLPALAAALERVIGAVEEKAPR